MHDEAVDDAKVNKNRLTLWLSGDARRLPLRADVEALVGSFRFTLRAATP